MIIHLHYIGIADTGFGDFRHYARKGQTKGLHIIKTLVGNEDKLSRNKQEVGS